MIAYIPSACQADPIKLKRVSPVYCQVLYFLICLGFRVEGWWSVKYSTGDCADSPGLAWRRAEDHVYIQKSGTLCSV